MTIIDRHSYPSSATYPLEWIPHPEIKRQFEAYEVSSFTEMTDPESALRVQQIHGISYVNFGFVHKAALDENGRLNDRIDRARGDSVSYYLATPKDGDPTRQASLRVIDIPHGGQPDDLPAFEYGKTTMYSGYEDILRQASSTGRLREVSSLSLAEGASPLASFELIRQIIQEAIKKNTNETWIINFVTSAHDSIAANFSPNTMARIGEHLMIGEGDDDISDDVKLVPVMIEPCKIPDQMVEYLKNDSVEQPDKIRVLKTLHFVLDGLEGREISDDVRRYVHALQQVQGNV